MTNRYINKHSQSNKQKKGSNTLEYLHMSLYPSHEINAAFTLLFTL